MTSAFIDLHSLITLRAPDVIEECNAFLKRRFPLFVGEDPDEAGKSDIVLLPLADYSSVSLTERYSQALHGFGIFDVGGKAAVGFTYKGTVDVLVVPTDPVKVLYRPRKDISRQLDGPLLFAMQLCLRRKDALMAHGSVVIKDERALLIAGHQGTRKTQLTLTFLNHGWDYLSDDKFLLHRGEAYLLESYLYLKDHHLEIPSLTGPLADQRPRRATGQTRAWLRSLAFQYLPGRIPWSLLRRLDPARQCDVAELAPGAAVHMTGRLSHGFMLLNGRDLEVEPIAHKELVAHLAAINRLLFRDALSMEAMLGLYTPIATDSVDEVLPRNLVDMPAHRVSIADNTPLNSVYERLLMCCEAP